MPLGGCQGCGAPSVARPGLDAGALRHYIATPPKKEAKKAEGQVQAEWRDDRSRRSPGRLRRAATRTPAGGEATLPTGALAIRKAPAGRGENEASSEYAGALVTSGGFVVLTGLAKEARAAGRRALQPDEAYGTTLRQKYSPARFGCPVATSLSTASTSSRGTELP